MKIYFQSLKCLLILMAVFLVTDKSHCQVNYKEEFKKLSCPEKRWVFFHPFIAKKAFRLTQQARAASKEMMKDPLLDGDFNGGQVDAFRHAYWMALLTQHICWRKARSLGKAHEKGNYKSFKKNETEEGIVPDSISSVMDLYNNQKGIEIGRVQHDIPEERLIGIVRDSIVEGSMKIIRKGKQGEALDCDGARIDMDHYKHEWNIPKCLVNSDFKYQR